MASLLTEHDEKEDTFKKRKPIMHSQNIQQKSDNTLSHIIYVNNT